MNAIEQILEKLKNYPQAKIVRKDNFIEVLPESSDGFSVSMSVYPDRHVVYYEGWHEEFKDEKHALNCFAFGLSDKCRLKVVSRGTYPYSWALENLQNGEWQKESVTGLLIFPFWRRRKISFLQNHLIIQS